MNKEITNELAEALKEYLSAGFKEERRLASIRAKKALSDYYGIEYIHVNKNK